MKHPFFTIVIPALNEEKYLPNLLESLSQQTWRDFEVIVVDGSSKDKTVEVAKSFDKKLPALHVLISTKARLPLQRNIGAQHAKGEWYVFIDADTVLLPYCLERLSLFIYKTSARFVTTWGRPDSEKSRESIHTLLFNISIEAAFFYHRPLSPGPFTAVQRTAFARVHGYDEALQFGEDQNFTQRLADAGISLSILRETLYIWSLRRFRTHGFFRASWIYVQAGLRVLFMKKNYSFIPGYIMGGHVYDKKVKTFYRSGLKQYESKLKKLMKELFE